MTNLKLPFEIEGYRIVRRLGLGGMATVYLGIQRSLGRPVAIKVLATDHTQSEELVRRFEHEARTIARLDHPHIVNISMSAARRAGRSTTRCRTCPTAILPRAICARIRAVSCRSFAHWPMRSVMRTSKASCIAT